MIFEILAGLTLLVWYPIRISKVAKQEGHGNPFLVCFSRYFVAMTLVWLPTLIYTVFCVAAASGNPNPYFAIHLYWLLPLLIFIYLMCEGLYANSKQSEKDG